MRSTHGLWLLACAALFAACASETVFGPDSRKGTSSNTSGSGASSGATSGAGGAIDCQCGIDIYVPMCGVDGNTYDAACGIECVPVEVACEGECPCRSCADLAAEYLEVLAQARACVVPKPESLCTTVVQDELPCPCSTYVNVASPASGELLDLQDRWLSQECHTTVECPAVPCDEPLGAYCGSDGSCTDVFPEG
jgi:hypothetical protein